MIIRLGHITYTLNIHTCKFKLLITLQYHLLCFSPYKKKKKSYLKIRYQNERKRRKKISCYIFLPNLASVFRMYITLNFLNHRSNCIRSSSPVFGPLPESISAIAYTIIPSYGHVTIRMGADMMYLFLISMELKLAPVILCSPELSTIIYDELQTLSHLFYIWKLHLP